MDEEYLNMLESIKNTMEEIAELEGSLHTILSAPEEYLEHLERIRSALVEIQALESNI